MPRPKTISTPVDFPALAYLRLRKEAKRRKVSLSRVIHNLLAANPRPKFRFTREQLGYDIDWDDEALARGIIVGEYAMEYLPPCREELQ